MKKDIFYQSCGTGKIHAALWDYAEKKGIKIEGLEKPKSDIHEDEEEESEEY